MTSSCSKMPAQLSPPPPAEKANLPIPAPPRPGWRERVPVRGRGWSISTRLTVLYTLCAFVILCLALSFLYWEVSTDLHDQEDQSLVDEITTLRVIISEHPNET